MRNWWIRFGCFLTGYNYSIVRVSSEATAKSVKRYTSALLIVCIIWAFVGYTFTQRYLQGTLTGSIFGALLAIIIIVQIERQIILSLKPSKGLYIFRGALALLMALIGAVIIDQMFLKQDIELEKISYIQKKVDELLPAKEAELKRQIFSLDTTIRQKELERQVAIDEVNKHPTIKIINSQTQSVPVKTTVRDSTGNITTSEILKPTTTVFVSNSPNPRQALIHPLDTLISNLRSRNSSNERLLLNVRPDLETQISSKTGFLDELKIMYSLISSSNIALGFWILWVSFLLLIEMLVLFSKMGYKGDDYEKTVIHQMELQIKQLDILAQRVKEK